MPERFEINSETGVFNPQSVQHGRGENGQIKAGSATWLGKKIEVVDANNQIYSLNTGSLIDFLIKNTDEGQTLKKGFLGLFRSEDDEVVAAFNNYKNRIKNKTSANNQDTLISKMKEQIDS